ncbi:MAG: NAD(P)-dependent oxidoreductase [Rubrivivax sp.]|nr:NAD(P)-dependent oxidoreductase [Rubrivivax sp.]
MARVGVVGIGNMGLAIALRLVDRGHDVAVRDIDPARDALAAGCAVCASPRDVAARSELVIVAVVDAVQVDVVLFGDDGIVQAGGPRTVILCPTIGVADVERCAARLAVAGLEAIDAPMSGGPQRARLGTMSLMVAAPEALAARWRGLLDDLAAPVFHVGTRPGDGARTKLVNNLLAAVNLAGAAEALALAERLGLDASRTLGVIEASSGQSWIGSDRLRRAISGDAVPRAHVSLLAKDSALALHEAQVAGLDAPVGRAAAACFADAVKAGLAGADDSALWRHAAGREPADPTDLSVAPPPGTAP